MSSELESSLERALALVKTGRILEALPDLRRAARLRGRGDGPWLYRAIREHVLAGDFAAAEALHHEAQASLVDRAYLPALAAALLPARDAYESAVAALDGTRVSLEENALLALPTQFAAAYQGRCSRLQQEQVARFYAAACGSLTAAPPRPMATGRLRVGFVSAHLTNHTVGKLTRGLIAGLDPERFESRVFAPAAPADEISRFVAATCTRFETIPHDLPAARARIAAAALDVLVYPDIGMEPLTYFLAFARLAPVQCALWGHPVTTGIPAIDYFISSRDLEADDAELAQSHYSERLVRLSTPPTYLYPLQARTPVEAPDLSFAAGRTIYTCAQQPLKFHPTFDRVLIEILRRDPNGVLVLLDLEPTLTRQLLARLAPIAPRIHVLPRLSQGGFMELLAASHVVLDTPYFSGGISSVEALGLGKVVVTVPDPELMAGRVTYAYYRQMDIDIGVARTFDDYVAVAVRFGTDPVARGAAEAKIRAAAPRLFGQETALREFEAFLLRVSLRAELPCSAPAL